MPNLVEELKALDPSVMARLNANGFDERRFLALAETLREGDPETRRRARNVVKGKVEAPPASAMRRLPAEGSVEYERLRAKGEAALRAGELAFCTMAGGMATRMGGIVKALAEVYDGHTFLDLRLGENRSNSARYGRPIPLWFMTSDATDEAIEKALERAPGRDHMATFQQDLSLRLTPDGTLFFGSDGKTSAYATGHGDLVDALRRSGLLDTFVANGGKWVWITNVDNLGASIDPVILGHFIEASETSGAVVQCEVTRKEGDRGGIPVLAEGKVQVLEEFRLPADFDPKTVDVFNTNTFLVRADALAQQPCTWTYFEVEKKADGKTAIQFERLLQEITAQMPSVYLEVPRDGAASRFLPVKDFDELAKRRANIEVVARARGMV